MSFWDKVKEFVGVEDDYFDDDFYDDYDDLDDYKNKEKVISDDTEVNDFSNNPSFNQSYTQPLKNENEESFNNEIKPTFNDKNKKEEKSFRRSKSSSHDYNNSKMYVSIREPLNYEDGKLVLDDIMEGKSVVLNLEMLEVDKKTQIFYFVSGGLYSLNGTIQNVTKDIYVLAPKGTEIDGQLKDEIINSNMHQL